MKLGLKRKSKNFVQGVFTAQNIQKYKGSFPIIYRSSLELKVMRWFDGNPNIITWGSESVVIPYVSPLDGRMHRYFVDFVIALKQKDGTIKKYIIEVKPYKQTIKPESSKHKKPKTIIYETTEWIKNQAKWSAAEQYAEKHNIKFLILTEKHISP